MIINLPKDTSLQHSQ